MYIKCLVIKKEIVLRTSSVFYFLTNPRPSAGGRCLGQIDQATETCVWGQVGRVLEDLAMLVELSREVGSQG